MLLYFFYVIKVKGKQERIKKNLSIVTFAREKAKITLLRA